MLSRVGKQRTGCPARLSDLASRSQFFHDDDNTYRRYLCPARETEAKLRNALVGKSRIQRDGFGWEHVFVSERDVSVVRRRYLCVCRTGSLKHETATGHTDSRFFNISWVFHRVGSKT